MSEYITDVCYCFLKVIKSNFNKMFLIKCDFIGPAVIKTLVDVIGENLPKPSEYGKTIRGTCS